ncbi:MAG: PLP-dependent aminotransferase family protein [Actinomycetota bacterium]
MRQAIRSGRLAPGTVLPSTRALADDRGLARATVVAAYEHLVAEGYLLTRPGAGTSVADLRLPRPSEEPSARPAPSFQADFRPGEPDGGLFPRAAWGRSVRRVLDRADDHLFGYGDQRGSAALREQLAQYLARSRAMFTSAESISIFGGLSSAFGFLAEAFLRAGIDRVAVEDPSLFLLRDILRLGGAEPVPVPIDHDGIDVTALAGLDVGAVIVTPAHQYPLGHTMAPGRRAELLEWARGNDAWIVEDDYDGEFRYDRQPIGSLQGLDPERVIYAGSASKSLAPALRIAWLALPDALVGPMAAVKHWRGGVSGLEQETLADLIERGELDRHLRHARTLYRRRHDALAERLQADVPWLDVPSTRAGLHLTATITNGIDENNLVRRAAKESIGLLGLRPHWLGPPTADGLVIGYSRLAEHQYHTALDRLIEHLRHW